MEDNIEKPSFKKEYLRLAYDFKYSHESLYDFWMSKINPLQSRILELEDWKKQMLVIWSPVMDWMQSNSSMKLGRSMSVEVLKRCQEYEKQLVEISELKAEIERLKK